MAGTRSFTWFLVVSFTSTWLIELGMFLAGGMSNPRAFQLGGAVVMLVPTASVILIACPNAFASGLLLLTADMDSRVGGAAGIVGIGLVLLLGTVLGVGSPVQGRSEQQLFSEPKDRAEPNAAADRAGS